MSKDAALSGPVLSLVPREETGPAETGGSHYRFRLYVAGDTPKSLAAIANLRRLCEVHLVGRHSIQLVDLVKHPELAASDQILAVPTLIRRLPPPIRRVIGSLADTEKVLVALELESDLA